MNYKITPFQASELCPKDLCDELLMGPHCSQTPLLLQK